MTMKRFEGKVAVVTGGNSGIGLAIAQTFQQEGASVVVFGRNKKTLDEAAASLQHDVLAIQGDVTTLIDLDRLYTEAAARFGKIDILVANAGIGVVRPIDQTDEALFDQISDVNFKGVFFTVQKALPHLKDGAAIVLVSSVANRKGLAGFAVYSATKAAVRSLARTFSAELLPRGIRVNVISPGPIQTPILHRMGLQPAQVEAFTEQVASQVPMKRFGTAQEMATVALFLASDDSSYLAGTEIIADGGMTQL